MTTVKSAQVMANRAKAEARRSEIAAVFRAKLLAELGGPLTVSQEALVDVAASAYAEVHELSAGFLRCSAGEEQMSRLGLARGQLVRVLRSLGLPNGTAGDPAAAEDLDALVARYTGKRKEVSVDGQDVAARDPASAE